MTKQVLPNMLIIGAMKAGTTLLYTLLGQHGDVWFPSKREPAYFTRPDYDDPGVWREYVDLFKPCPKSTKIVSEASTSYTKLPRLGPTPQRIRERLGEPKLIYIVRDPVARTISNYRHSYIHGSYRHGTTVEEAIHEDPIIVAGSRYATQLRAYQDEFGPDSILVLITEDLHENHPRVMSEIAGFLGISPIHAKEKPLPAVNTIGQQVFRRRVNNVLGVKLAERVRELLPRFVKNRLKSFASIPPKTPEITDAHEDAVFEQIADDLEDLRTLLGDRIDRWPSVKKLPCGAHVLASATTQRLPNPSRRAEGAGTPGPS